MSLSIVEEKDKVINELSAKLTQAEISSILTNNEEIPFLSPEHSQYPEGASEAGGDTTVLESQKMSFRLSQKLMEIGKNSDSGVLHSGGQSNQKVQKKSYSLESINPYTKAPAPTKIITDDSALNATLLKIQSEIGRKRSAQQMQEFVDFNDGSKDVSNDKSKESDNLAKINHKKKMNHQNDGHKAKRAKVSDRSGEGTVEVQKDKKMKVSKGAGWIQKTNKPKNVKKDYDAFDVLESSKDIDNDKHSKEKSRPKRSKRQVKNTDKTRSSSKPKISINKQPKSKAHDPEDGLEDYKISEGDETLLTKQQDNSMSHELIDDQDQTHISLTDGKTSLEKSGVVVEKIDEEVIETKDISKQQKSKKGDKEVKFRETCRNREERRQKKGQECERCQQVSS